jgi:energy-coupling factor transporter ATP-binding protein EcfA2
MVTLIIGHQGAGKTKKLISLVNELSEEATGNIVCVEKKPKLTYDVNYRVRLIATDDFKVSGFDAFYGFLSGICAGDNDITDIFIDATLRIGGRDYNELAAFIAKIDALAKGNEKNFTFTISADREELPVELLEKYNLAQ